MNTRQLLTRYPLNQQAETLLESATHAWRRINPSSTPARDPPHSLPPSIHPSGTLLPNLTTSHQLSSAIIAHVAPTLLLHISYLSIYLQRILCNNMRERERERETSATTCNIFSLSLSIICIPGTVASTSSNAGDEGTHKRHTISQTLNGMHRLNSISQ